MLNVNKIGQFKLEFIEPHNNTEIEACELFFSSYLF